MAKQIDDTKRDVTVKGVLTVALDSGKVRTAGAFLLGAVAFVLANLLLARHLTPTAFGLLTLAVAISAAASPVAPFGLTVILVRRHLSLDRKLLLRCAYTSVVVAVGAVALTATLYNLSHSLLIIIAITIVGGGFTRLASARLQRDERFLASTLASESGNYVLFLAALGTLAIGSRDPLWPLASVCVAQALIAGFLSYRLQDVPRGKVTSPTQLNLSEMLALTGANAATMVLTQLERVAIPIFFEIEALAEFAVLAMFTIAPFRPLEVSVYRTLLPRLSRSTSVSMRRQLLMQEFLYASLLFVGLGTLIVAVTPAIVNVIFSGKYDFSVGMMVCGIMLGQIRVVRSIFSAAIAAIAEQRALLLWTLVEWASVLAAFMGGWLGSRYGLQGFLWGVISAGFLASLLTFYLAFWVIMVRHKN
jgi:O-antigen/teichoic acid export membrane protein